MSIRILAIETSCDETAIAIAEFFGTKKNPKINVLSSIISSQVKLHAKFGGVVPNLAKREHQKDLVPALLTALKKARLLKPKAKDRALKPQLKIKNPQATNHKLQTILEREQELLKNLKKKILSIKPPKVDAIAVTYGPGLAPALWVGVNFAKALSYLWHKPLIPVNHMAGHFFSAFVQGGKENGKLQIKNYKFPLLGLLVSGGHTELVLVKKPWNFTIIGETLDDAAGEAFDKVARILGLGYPGGPQISALAEMELKNLKFKINLPRPMINSNDFNFSFSGLKTAVLYLTRDLGKAKTKKLRQGIAREFQNAAVDVLTSKTIRAAKKYKVRTILLGGGVAANNLLRKKLAGKIVVELPKTNYLLPATNLTGDNALMITLAAYFTGKKKDPTEVGANANIKL